ncbi:hypothetical protein DYB32_009543 [Aphanomyces invadans]|uniref:BZIP domain-containing protein n=1 Tax=Aphanomyces invadans TaxID=157072 RepID=A0A418AI39_9STRA|nr:hypothetical protein DYB32_009543 [Aphanomyces invadans]
MGGGGYSPKAQSQSILKGRYQDPMSGKPEQHQGHMNPDMMHPLMYEYLNRSQQGQHNGPPHGVSMMHHAGQQPQMSTSMTNGHHSSNMSNGASSPTGSDNLDKQDELDARRRLKNRERVRKCRKRKQDRLNFLEDRNNELEKENGELKTKIMRRGDGSPINKAMTEEALLELRAKQTNTLQLAQAIINEGMMSFEASAKSVWTPNATVLDGVTGEKLTNIDVIIENKRISASVFSNYKVKNFSADWQAHDKAMIKWDIEASLRPNAPSSIALSSPFHQLAPHFNNEMFPFHMVSHVTFSGDKIAEEVRFVDVAKLISVVVQKQRDPSKIVEIVQAVASTSL